MRGDGRILERSANHPRGPEGELTRDRMRQEMLQRVLSGRRARGRDAMTRRATDAVARQRAGLPVSEWEPALRAEGGGWKHNYVKVEQFMTTDLYTVQEDVDRLHDGLLRARKVFG